MDYYDCKWSCRVVNGAEGSTGRSVDFNSLCCGCESCNKDADEDALVVLVGVNALLLTALLLPLLVLLLMCNGSLANCFL